jgi:ArsR family transcriptional regulator
VLARGETGAVSASAPGKDRSPVLTQQYFLMYNTLMTTATRAASPDLDRAVQLFHALSDSTRLSILEMLRDGERCVCELQDELDAAQSRLSFHLRVLREAGLVMDRREGRWSYYSIIPEALEEVHDLAVGMQPKKGALRVLRKGECCA